MHYCQFCGTKLEDGQSCTCEMSKAAGQPPQPGPFQPQQPTAPTAPPIAGQPPQPGSFQPGPFQPQQPAAPAAPPAESQASILLKKFKGHLSAYFSNPAQATLAVMGAEYEIALPIILTVIRLLAMGLALYGLLRKLCEDALTLITTELFRYTNMADVLTAKLSVSLPGSLFFGALIALIGMFLFIFMLFLLVRIRHGNASFSDIFKASAANGIPTTALLLLAFLISFVSSAACVACFALAMLSWIISGILTAQIVCPNSSSGTFGLMYFVGVALVILVGCWIIPTVFSWSLGGITASYMGETATLGSAFTEVRKSLAEENISGFKEFYGDALKRLYEESISGFWDTMF